MNKTWQSRSKFVQNAILFPMSYMCLFVTLHEAWPLVIATYNFIRYFQIQLSDRLSLNATKTLSYQSL